MNTFAIALARKLNTTTSLESVEDNVNIINDEILDVDGAAVSPVAPATDEPIIEAQETELQVESTAITAVDDEILETNTDVETLESIQLVLQNSLANEGVGLNTVSYEMLNINMSHIYRKYGIDSKRVMPSMEAFHGDNRVITTVSLEKVSDTLKTIGEGAKELLKKLWFKIKQFMLSLVTLSFGMKKRVAAISKKAESLDKNSESTDIKLYAGNRLHYDKKVPEKKELIDRYKMTSSGLEQMVDFGDKVLERKTITDQEVQSYWQGLVHGIGRVDKHLAFQDAEIVINKNEDKTKPHDYKFVTNAPSPERGQDSANYTVKSLSPSEIIDVCDAIEKSLEALEKYGKTYKNAKVENLVEDLAAMDLSKPDAEGETPLFGMDTKTTHAYVTKMIKNILLMHSKFINYINTINKAMLDYCAQSLSTHTKAEKAK